MYRLILSFFLLILPLSPSFAGGEREFTTIEEFYELVNKELILSEQFVDNLLQEMLNKQIIPSDMRRIQYEMAKTSLEVKKTLVANFVETSSILREEVQDKLLEILRKNWIDQLDLLELTLLTKTTANGAK